MLKLEIILAENDVMKISEGLKKIGNLGDLNVIKVRGRGAKTAAEIHTQKEWKYLFLILQTNID
ncbi:MAG: hypothetical protein CM1200mP11_2110 [Nitrosopumilaceae archaeon]|nr:MAG: hypothetical protein CM1200mP11_2110 [Nitrosopumilaceae archaeon]